MQWTGEYLRQKFSAWRPERVAWVAPVVALAALTLAWAWPRPAAILPSPEPLHGSLPYATLLCEFAGAPTVDTASWSVAYYDRLMLGDPDSVDKFWREVSYGAINLAGSKAFGWFQMAKPASAYRRGSQPDLDALARDCTATADRAAGKALYFPKYAGLNLVFSECIDRSRGGAMELTLDGRRQTYRVTWVCPGYASSHQIFSHEIGHSFGLTHSEDAQGSEYGNNWDVMSNAAYCAPSTPLGTLAQQPIAYDKDVLGWIAPRDKYMARGPGTVTIQLDNLEQLRANSPGYLLAEIPLPGGRFYTVEARARSGYDLALPSAGVLIHEVDPRRTNRARLVTGDPTAGRNTLLTAMGGWPVGSAFIDRENNVGISVDAQVDRGFVVTLYLAALPWPLAPGQQARSDDRTMLAWQPAPRGEYEVQVSRMASGSSTEWGATFVSTQPYLEAPLALGRYRWQVRAVPGGMWSPAQDLLVDRNPGWHPPEQVAGAFGSLRVPPAISVGENGQVEIAWAQDGRQRMVAVTRAALQAGAWAVEDLFSLPRASQRDLALSFTPAGDLKVAWPNGAIGNRGGPFTPALALDARGRAHAIWAGSGQASGLFSAIFDAQAATARPLAAPQVALAPVVHPVRIADDAPNGEKYSPALALDGNGNAQAVWIDTRDGHAALYAAQQYSGAAWGLSQRLSGPGTVVYGRPSVAVDRTGHAYSVWQSSLDCGEVSTREQVSFAERLAGHAWQPADTLTVASSGARLIAPVVAANEGGEVYAAWGELDGASYRLFAAYRGKAGEWKPPQLVGDGPAELAPAALSLAVGVRGDAYLTWAETQPAHTSIRFAAAH